ncbi:unnamed protein product [Choristocarpus tenellus]
MWFKDDCWSFEAVPIAYVARSQMECGSTVSWNARHALTMQAYLDMAVSGFLMWLGEEAPDSTPSNSYKGSVGADNNGNQEEDHSKDIPMFETLRHGPGRLRHKIVTNVYISFWLTLVPGGKLQSGEQEMDCLQNLFDRLWEEQEKSRITGGLVQ